MSRHITRSAALWVALLIPAFCASAEDAVPTASFAVQSYIVEGDNPLGEDEARAILAPYTGGAVDLARLQEATNALETALQERGYGLYRVTLPPQDATGGTVRFRVLKFSLARVTIKGNKHFDEANIRASVPELREGEAPNMIRLARELAVANEAPSKRVSVAFKEADRPDAVEAGLEVADSAPSAFFGQLTNSGSESTGRYRVTLGAQHSNLFNRDHAATLTYTTSPDAPERVRQWGGYYRVPLYGIGASLLAYYSRSTVDSGRVADFFDVSGRGRFGGVQFVYHLTPMSDYRHSVLFGVDDRLFQNSVSYVPTGQPQGVDVRSRPLVLGYTGRWERRSSAAGFNVELVGNLNGGARNDDATYEASRAGAPQGWQALRFGGDYAYRMGEDAVLGLVSLRFRGQSTDDPLISGEQFGIGGAASVRGVPERAIAGDSGVQASLEVWSRALPGNLRLLGFADYGRVWREQPAAGTAEREGLVSLGAGVRWQPASMVSFAADYGRLVRGTSVYRSGDDELHVSLSVRY